MIKGSLSLQCNKKYTKQTHSLKRKCMYLRCLCRRRFEVKILIILIWNHYSSSCTALDLKLHDLATSSPCKSVQANALWCRPLREHPIQSLCCRSQRCELGRIQEVCLNQRKWFNILMTCNKITNKYLLPYRQLRIDSRKACTSDNSIMSRIRLDQRGTLQRGCNNRSP